MSSHNRWSRVVATTCLSGRRKGLKEKFPDDFSAFRPFWRLKHFEHDLKSGAGGAPGRPRGAAGGPGGG